MSDKITKEYESKGLVLDPLLAIKTGFKLNNDTSRGTHSRGEMMSFIQEQVAQLQN